MIDRQSDIVSVTVLTAMSVTTENVLPREDNLLERNANVDGETNDAGKRQGQRYGTQDFAIGRFDQLSLAKVQQDYRLLDVAHTERLVVLVENKHLAVHLPVRAVRFSVGILKPSRVDLVESLVLRPTEVFELRAEVSTPP